jgi:hypothetical protein
MHSEVDLQSDEQMSTLPPAVFLRRFVIRTALLRTVVRMRMASSQVTTKPLIVPLRHAGWIGDIVTDADEVVGAAFVVEKEAVVGVAVVATTVVDSAALELVVMSADREVVDVVVDVASI